MTLTTLRIVNFRSIKEQHIELAPITVVYGPNGAGKSSLIYALLSLRNVVLNPNQDPSGFFNFGFVNLGGFEAVVFDHQPRQTITLGLTLGLGSDNAAIDYGVRIGEQSGEFLLQTKVSGAGRLRLTLPVSFPYPANQQKQEILPIDNAQVTVVWNGVLAQVQPSSQEPEALEAANALAALLNTPPELIRKFSVTPLIRGFTKPYYSTVSVSPLMVTEDEVATYLSTDKYLVGRISHYLEEAVERDFRVNFRPGTAIFSLDSTDKRTGVTTELVNDGFGVNQIVHFLARALHKETVWAMVEEPEVHLHPSAIRRLARLLGRLVHEERKKFLLSTHSESIITALLAMVARKELEPGEIRIYLARKVNRATEFEKQPVNEHGQIEGGLRSFMEEELEDIKAFLGAKEGTDSRQ